MAEPEHGLSGEEEPIDRERAIPDGLREGPSGEPPPPPVDTAAQTLPFNELTWENFERLCLSLAEVDGNPQWARRFGVSGQAQDGIDIYSRLNDESYATYQCKRRESIDKNDLIDAVAEFKAGSWAEKSQRFVFCTSKGLVRTELATEIETQADALQEIDVALEVWDSEGLSAKLKTHPGIVEDFFGAAWLEKFFRPEAARELNDREAFAAAGGIEKGSGVRLVTIDWAPSRVQAELEALQSAEGELFALLTDAIGTPPGTDSLGSLLANPPDWLTEASAGLWALLARICENSGAWTAARLAWEGAAKRSEERAAFFLAAGAAAAGVEDDDDSKQRLIEQARAIDPEEPRVLLVDFDDTRPAAERLASLEGLDSEDPEVRSLLAAHRAIAALQLPDLDLAEEQLTQLKADAPESALAVATEVNLAVQRGRFETMASRPIDAPTLRGARSEALKLRDRLLKQHRFEESARLLMLAADASALMGERGQASELLRGADPAELRSRTGAEVLAASAAGRALDYRLALELLESGPNSPGKKLIEAECLEEVGGAIERQQALATLEEIVSEDNSDSSEAAFVRLAATLGGRETAWSEDAATYLREHGHVKAAVVAEVVYQARWHADYEKAEGLLAPHLDLLWAKAARLRLAIQRGRWDPMKEAADDVMGAGPSQQLRLDAGRAYAKSRNFDRAREVLLNVARDPGGPPGIRSEAFRFLLEVVGKEQTDWKFAAELHREWVALDPGNSAASMWAPTIANRLRRRLR